MDSSIQVKSEKTDHFQEDMSIKEEANDVTIREEELIYGYHAHQEDDDENDPVEQEIDVYLAKSLSNKIYILQVSLHSWFYGYRYTNL